MGLIILNEELTILQKFNILAEVECKSQKTIKSYHRYINDYIQIYGDEISQETIIDYLYMLKTKRHYSNSTLNIVKYALMYYYREVLKKGIIILPHIKRAKSVPKPVHQNIIKSMLDNTKNQKHWLVIGMDYDTGLRPFELRELKWEWVDIENKEGFVIGGKGNKDGKFFFSKIIANALKEHKEFQDKKYGKNFCKFVFESEQHPEGHISPRTHQNIIKNACKRAGIEIKMWVYRLRHSFGSHQREAGRKLENIQLSMRHNTMNTTLGYVKVAKPEEAEVNLMDNMFPEGKTENYGV